jgi:hypothetical protein
MGTAFTLSHMRQGRGGFPRLTIPANVSAGEGWLLRDIARRVPGGSLGNLDVSTLKKLLQEAEHVMANTSLLLKSAIWCANMGGYPVRHRKKSRAA